MIGRPLVQQHRLARTGLCDDERQGQRQRGIHPPPQCRPIDEVFGYGYLDHVIPQNSEKRPRFSMASPQS
ncbi:hypothetical protein GCM10011372_35650 [Agromyces bauzanensis]|uniref:Uncharacterized protein n=1 Tax=Agromyces bauzanensis TaxID=1308924 RepID=A0A917PVZ7_9MICO|nr:hypothetical protein GCM10011372_35650 [Agromyces bauzanensis]